jgi:large subunit ribosomal protein L3
MSIGIIGKKLGMTQMFDENGARIPVTVIEAGPCPVLQVKTADGRDGYNAVQLGFGKKSPRKVTQPMAGHFALTEAEPCRILGEFRYEDTPDLNAGDQVTVDRFGEVKKVDVQGLTKGRGYAGWMKRWNFAGQRMSHGNSISHRRPGSQGRTYSTAKGVPKGKKQAGHYGNEKVTIRGLKLIKVDAEKNLLVIKGAVPGPNGGFLRIRRSIHDR